MARSVNKWIGIGNLGKAPELRTMPDGKSVASCSIACGESWTDKTTGEKVERTEWVNLTFFGRLADIAGEYLKKGARIYVEGKIRTDKWQDKEGNDRYTTKIVVDEMMMLDGKTGGESRGADESAAHASPVSPRVAAQYAPTQRAAAAAVPQNEYDIDDDIPF